MQKLSYPCSMDKKVKTISFLLLVLLVGVFGVMAVDAYAQRSGYFYIAVATLVVVGVLLCYVPLRLELTADALVIHKIIGRRQLPFSRIVAVSPREQGWKGDIRVCGSGGLLGFLGWFRSREVGTYFSYVTDTSSMFWVITADRTYLLSCNDSGEMVGQLSERIK